MRWYLHIDMDAFFVSVERALNPQLEGRPVVVGGGNGRGVVTSASYEARRYGVCSAMAGFQARRLCPNAIFLPTRHDVYGQYSSRVFSLLKCYSPVVRKLSIDEGLVDLTGTERLLGLPLNSAHEIILRLQRELKLPASGGLASHGTVAKIAASLAKPKGLICVPHGAEKKFLSFLPVGAIPGVGPKAQSALLRQGVATVGALLARSDLRQRYLGLDGPVAAVRARGHSIGSETTLEKSLNELGTMEEVLWQLVEDVGSRLRDEARYARCIAVKIRYDDFKTFTRARTLRVPTCFDRDIFAVAVELLHKNITPGKKIRLLGVTARGLLASGWQESLFEFQKRSSWEKLYRGIDSIRHRYGDQSIGAAPARGKAS
jgi:DNA polymerase IV